MPKNRLRVGLDGTVNVVDVLLGLFLFVLIWIVIPLSLRLWWIRRKKFTAAAIVSGGGANMSCPYCGQSGNSLDNAKFVTKGARPAVSASVSVYECLSCRKRFRLVINQSENGSSAYTRAD